MKANVRRIEMRVALSAAPVLLAIMFAQVATSDTLWEQSDFDPWGAGFPHSVSGGPPFGSTVYGVSDVSVECGWLVETITTYYSAMDFGWGEAIYEGNLHVWEKTGPLPVNGVHDPAASPVVPVTAVLNGDHWVVTATGLNLDLPPGEYWIGITPSAPAGMWGPEIHLISFTQIGDATASYDLHGTYLPAMEWGNLHPGMDATIKIEGVINGPSATERTTWGGIKSLYQD